MKSNYRKLVAGLGCLALAIAIAGCSSSSSTTTAPKPNLDNVAVSIVEGSVPTEEQKKQLTAAKEALFTELSGRLVEVMSSQGPVAAIGVCKKEATEIAARVGKDQGVQIGRIGVRLRNPDNTAPSWATPLTNAKTGTPTFATLSNGHAAALLPIKLQSQCLMCHGPKEQIPQAVGDQLAKLYPDDEATGFQEGDLRGWFWVELPSS